MGFGFEIIKIHRPGGPLEAVEVRAKYFDFLFFDMFLFDGKKGAQEIEKFPSDFEVFQRASWTVDFDNFKAKTYQKGSI